MSTDSGRGSNGQFAQGKSGNPAGRPKGARNQATRAVELLLEGQAERLTQAAVEKALEGDGAALKLCLDRIAPIRKGRPVPLNLPDITDAKSLADAGTTVGSALASGELSAEEASAVVSTLDGIRKLHETSQLEQRIAALEQARGADK